MKLIGYIEFFRLNSMSIPNFLKKIDYFCPICKKFSILGLHLILFHPAVGEPLSACLPRTSTVRGLPVGRDSRMRTALCGRPYVSQITISKEVPPSL